MTFRERCKGTVTGWERGLLHFNDKTMTIEQRIQLHESIPVDLSRNTCHLQLRDTCNKGFIDQLMSLRHYVFDKLIICDFYGVDLQEEMFCIIKIEEDGTELIVRSDRIGMIETVRP